MSDTSSDAESSCGWTIISNEGSDIETLGSEAAVEFGERPPVVKPEVQETPSSSGATCGEVKVAKSHNDTLEQNTDETLCVAEAQNNGAEKEHVSLLSSSDHSDIMTLGDVKDDDHAEVDASVHEEFYLGSSCSSQYAFTAAETVFPAQQHVVKNWSSSEDEAGGNSGTAVRRRRLRRSTSSPVTEPEGDEVLESSPSDEEEEEEHRRQEEEEEEEGGVRPAVVEMRMPEHQGSGVLNKCILLALIVAVSVGFGHFYGTVQIQKSQKLVEKARVNVLYDVKDLPLQHVRERLLSNQRGDFDLEDLDEHNIISVLTDVIEEIQKQNEELNIKQAHMQAQRDDLKVLLKQKVEEKTHIVSQQQKLAADNQQLRSSLEREEKSLSILQEELKSLRSKIKDLEAMGAGADSLLSENQRLKEELEEEKQLIRNFMGQKEDLMVEAQTLQKKLDRERKVTDELRKEINELRGRISGAEKETSSEAEELQSRLSELEKRLSFEQQRSDLWERLYVETKEERAKGDTEPKVRKSKEGMAGKVKETFDAVKNSTKEFVHHHKEQIKKAKEAVKENLRKFSDSVKSTFRHFKDSASTFINKARGFYDKKHNKKESWQHRSHKHHRNTNKFDDFFQTNHNTRKSTDNVHEDQRQNTHKTNNPKGCAGVFDCAYQESMNLFNKAMEPIRADEFYQLLQSYVQQEVDHFHHWKELEMFINNFFHNGVFIHDQMLFTDFVSGVEDYLSDMHEYHGLDDNLFGDLDDYIYRHFFGDAYSKSYGPSGPFERPDSDSKEELKAKHQQRKQQRSRPRPHSERKWSRTGRNADRHMADVKIELGPMPFDPKY